MVEQPPASVALEKLHIPHQIFTHDTPVTSFEQAASERGQRPGQIVRSILFNIRADEFLLVLVAGPDQIDWRRLRQLVKRSRVRMATEAEVLEVTGYRVGTVSPFGLPRPLQVLIDASVLKEEEVSIGSGVRSTAIILKTDDLRRALGNAQVVSLLEGSEP